MGSQPRSTRVGLLTFAAAALCALGFAGSAHALTTYNVTPNDAQSLRTAIDQANDDGDDSLVNVPAGTYQLDPADGELTIVNDGGSFTLTGAGARSTIIDGGGAVVFNSGGTTPGPVFTIAATCKGCPGPASATFSGITVTGGDNDEGDGGAFLVENNGPSELATLHLFDSTITVNQAARGSGGGVFNSGVLDVQRVTFSNNGSSDWGSGVGTRSIDQSDAPARGKTEIFATTSIENSTFTGNVSDDEQGCSGGGAVYVEDASTSIVNSTIVGNTSFDGSCDFPQPTGGGIDMEPGGSATIVNSIVTGNTASPRQQLAASPRGTGPAGPTVASNCSVNTEADATLTSLGHNIESATDCGFTAGGDQQNVADPKLGDLANNGGQMDTMALLAGSPAIDHADSANCPATDEIGTTRPQGPACDVGAYEVIVPKPPAPPVTPPVTPPAKPAAPKVGVAGVRRACVSRSFHVRFHVATTASVKSVVVKLDGRRIKKTSKGSFTLTINSKRLKAGRHRLTITATDSAGQTTTSHRTFSVCKAAKPRRHAAPRFTG